MDHNYTSSFISAARKYSGCFLPLFSLLLLCSTLGRAQSTCPTSISATITQTNVTCNGNDDASITVSNPTGASGSVSYEASIDGINWFPVSAASPYIFNNLPSGSYDVQLRFLDENASVPTLFSTGVDGNGAPLSSGAVDPHYTLTESYDPAFPGPDVFIYQSGGWFDPTGTLSARWITPNGSTASVRSVGNYIYSTTFDLTDFDPATVELNGQWAVDNFGVDILLNGVSLGISYGGFSSLDAFTITSGFQSGLNTLEFIISNQNGSPNPSGFLADISATGMKICTYPSISTVSITEPTSISATITQTNVTCNGNDDASITVSNPTGGNGSANYETSIDGINWFPVSAASPYTFNNLPSGSYDIQLRLLDGNTSVPTLFSTGVDGNGDPLSNGAVDPHYTLTESYDPAFPGPDVFIYYPSGGWFDPTGTLSARWITPNGSTASVRSVGNYIYSTTFDLTDFDPATVELNGQWAVDNFGVDILLNGVSLGISYGGYSSLDAFTITSGFQSGLNTLDFIISNQNSSPNPSGVLVDLSATATGTGMCTNPSIGTVSITEPATLSLMPTITQPSCFDFGSITLSVSGGTSPYTYNWTDIEGGINPQDRSGLVAGNYEVTVTDAKGCAVSSGPTIAEAYWPLNNSTNDASGNGYNPTAGSSIDSYSTDAVEESHAAFFNGTSNGLLFTQQFFNNPSSTFSFSAWIKPTDLSGDRVIFEEGGAVNGFMLWINNGQLTLTTRDANIEINALHPTFLTTDNTWHHVAATFNSGTLTVYLDGVGQSTTGSYTNISSHGDEAGLGRINGSSAALLTTGSYSGYMDAVRYSKAVSWSAAEIAEESGAMFLTLLPATNCGPISICLNDPITTFSVDPDPLNDTYVWTVPTGAVITSGQGSPAITVDWSGGVSGSYQVCVEAMNACGTSDPICQDINVVDIVATVSTNPVCVGDDLQFFASGGDTYQWSGPSGFSSSSANPTIPNANGALHNGTYSVTVTNAAGCQEVATIDVIVNAAVVLDLVVVSPSICGSASGAIELTVIEGTSPYTFAWSNGATIEDISNIPSGNYTVTVTDVNGCVGDISTVILINSDGPVLSTTQVDPLCFGDNSGSIDLSVNSPNSPYTYNWSNGTSSEDLSDLTAGIYDVTVTDATGCYSVSSAELLQPDQLVTDHTRVNVSCAGEATGSIDLIVNGGTPAYSYFWTGPGGYTATTQDISSLSAGTYDVTITDANMCTATRTILIAEPMSGVSATPTSTDVSCSGDNDGQILLTVTGGTAPYTYSWTGGGGFTAMTKNISGLVAGTYDVTITDAMGCMLPLTGIVVNAPPLLEIIDITVDPVECFGEASGGVDITVGGGTPIYSYLWSNGSTTQDIANVVAGTYSVTVTDANGCTLTSSAITVAEPAAPLAASAVPVEVDCFGNDTGSIDLTVSGGSSSYTYLWSNAMTDEDPSGLVAGTYSVTVTDANGCTTIAFTTVNQPPAITLGGVVTNVLCNGDATGGIDVTAGGGVGGLTYAWSDGPSTLEDRTGLTAGTYTVTVTDENSCSNSQTFTVTEPLALVLSIINTDISCAGGADGDIDLSVSGGITPYTYAWSNGPTTQDIDGLAAGSYTVTVTDGNGCMTMLTSDPIEQPDSVMINLALVQNVSCKGGDDGSVTANVTGGTLPYSYQWSGGELVQTPDMLTAGDYSVTVTDANGCIAQAGTVTVDEPSTIIMAFATPMASSSCGGSTGSIDVTVTDGTAPYSYAWTGLTPIGDVEDPAGLAPGTYTVIVTDALGCSATVMTDVLMANPLNVIVTTFDPDCANTGGAAFAVVSGGVEPYTYAWSTSATTENLDNLSAGVYSVTVTDANGCTANNSGTLSVPSNCAPPVAQEDPYCTDPEVTVFGDVSLNDSDQDNLNSELTFINLSFPDSEEGTLDWDNAFDGNFTFTPAPGFTGTVVIPYQVCDPTNLCDEANITITIQLEAGANGATTFCEGEAMLQNLFDIITGEDPGGAWTETSMTSSGVAIGDGTMIDFSSIAAGVYTFTYTHAASGACLEDVSIATVNVINNPTWTSTTTVNPVCGLDNGQITFFFTDDPDRSQIKFSIDGGLTYPYSSPDQVGSRSTPANLAPGTYDLYALWGNGECPVDIPDVTLIEEFDSPILSVGAVVCVDGSTYEYTFAASPGATVVSTNGTISGNTVTVAVGANDVLTATNIGNCEVTLNITSPVTCDIMCEQPDLTLGNGVCNGTTYSISFTETTGAMISTSAGTIMGNVISGIPVGTDIVVTATNAADGDCVSVLTATSPDDCDEPCPDELISVSALGICAIDGTTYSVNFILAPGATLTTDPVLGTIGTNVITGIPGGTSIRLIATNAACNKTDDIVVQADCATPFVKLNLRVLLQGALLGSLDGLMRDDLRNREFLPATEPYTALDNFTHVGGGGSEMVTNPGTVFASLGNNSIIDWVFVELRSSLDPTVVLETRSGLLQKDGDVVDIDGVSPLCFTQSGAGNYYVAVRHRNHLGTMTAVPIALSPLVTQVDFTDTNLDLWNNQPIFNNREQKVVNGQYALWAGNTLSDDRVVFAGQLNDKDPIFNRIDSAPGNFFKIQTYILPGYNLTDVNLDGDTIFAGQKNDVDPIFNNVDGHPANFFKIQTFIIFEQLAQ